MKVSERFKVGITRYQPSDASDLAEFQRESFGPDARQLDRERFVWLYERNPAARDEAPGIWVCRRDDKIVGQQAEIAFDLLIDGVEQRSAWAIDLMVDPAWRLRGVGPGLVATQLEGREVVAGLTQSGEAYKSYMRSGWIDAGLMPTYVRPLDGRRFLQVEPLPRRLGRWAGVIGPALRGADTVLAGALRAAGARLAEVDRFDDRVDEVWTRAATDYGVIAKRDALTTQWRLDEHPEREQLRRFYLMRGGRALGYVALRPHERRGERAALVVDYLAPRNWVAPLLSSAAQMARRDGAYALVCRTKCEQADRALKAVGFVRRGVDVAAPLRLVVHSGGSDQASERLGSSGAWFLTSADSDLS